MSLKPLYQQGISTSVALKEKRKVEQLKEDFFQTKCGEVLIFPEYLT